MEAFTNLLRVWPDAGLHERQRELIELMMTRIIDPKTHHLLLFMKDDWTPVGDEFSYGHDIELAWLLVEAAEQLGEAALIARAKAEAVAIARVTAAEGLDHDGSVYNEGTAHGARRDQCQQGLVAAGRGGGGFSQRLPAYLGSKIFHRRAAQLGLYRGQVCGSEVWRLVRIAGSRWHA